MRAIALCLIATSLFTAAAAEPLAPGRPAGVHAARYATASMLEIGLGAAVMTGVGILASGGGSALASNPISGGQQPPIPVSNSTSATSSTGT